METRKRSIIKSIVWRIIATITSLLIIFALTGSLEKAGYMALCIAAVNICVYYAHERAWAKIRWGRISR